MKGLLIKDLYVISGQMKFFLIFALVMAATPGTGAAFALVYAALLPYTAQAYDERSKWDHLAAMMPYSTREIVLSKYLLGWICVGAVALVALAAQLLLPWAKGGVPLLLAFSVSMLILALIFPFMIRFGVEKGRTIFIFAMVALSVGTTTALSGLLEEGFDFSRLNLLLPVAAVLGSLLSMRISIALYPKRSC